ncbi:hypothetical protein [uncultured Lamprocystis sp.]|uniref:hypothetical protein n=1 Tax=uncultured Lamprocystis sp. TaxID=543132 RepID=UPI0025F8D905|nr:hypothetical protein [uncultured Lamprocystis sp.]
MTGQPEQKILIIAGPNGAGKTTFAEEFLPNEAACPTFINADLIAAGLSPFAPDLAAMKAGRLMLAEVGRRRYESGWRNFTGVYRPLVDEWALYDNAGSKPQLLEEGVNS